MDVHPAANVDSHHSFSLYNATLKTAAHLLGLPSRMLARIRRLELEGAMNQDAVSRPRLFGLRRAGRFARAHGAPGGAGEEPPIGLNMAPVPGPLGFLTSGYFFGLFVMALVLNRIQNLVVPSRNPLAMRMRAARLHGSRWSLAHMAMASFFPMDLSSTFSRTVFRIPSIYLLMKALFIWTVMLLQVSHIYPASSWNWLQAVGDWVSQKSMEDICWFTFTSTCVSLAVGALTNGLEGLHLNHNAPFNLFSFAFQLHIYGSPSTHIENVPGRPSRPSEHVIITILIPLLQLTWLHCLEVKKNWARMRLIPTSVSSLLNLVHFHSVFWTSPASYPLTNFFPCVVESMLCFVVLLSLSVNFIAQFLLEGAITRPLFGHAETLMPKLDEDFAVVLVRLSTASLEVTSAAGLGNEVGGITSIANDLARRGREEDRSAVEIDRSGVVSINGPPKARKRGLVNEIKNVKARAKRADMWADAIINIGWLKALALFLLTAAKVFALLSKRIWAFVRNRGVPIEETLPAQPQMHNPVASVPSAGADLLDEDGDADDTEVYRRFLRGEALSDDDDDFDPSTAGQAECLSDTPSSPSDDGEDAGDGETVQLYADLSQEASSPASAPVLLAHMTSDSPLTRRRFRQLVSETPRDGDDDDTLVEIARERRNAKASMRDNDSPEARRNCVICTVEPRDIICWPCRCLALCNDCRENLASRSSASKHTCPCCRRSVEGYSKIYIP